MDIGAKEWAPVLYFETPSVGEIPLVESLSPILNASKHHVLSDGVEESQSC